MSEIFYALAVLACPVGMGLMMWFMMRGKKGSADNNSSASNGIDAELTKLRNELDQLRAAERDGGPAPSTGVSTKAAPR